MTTPTLPIDYATLKTAIRSGLSAKGRQQWYALLPTISQDGSLHTVNVQGFKQIANAMNTKFNGILLSFNPALLKLNYNRPGPKKTNDILALLRAIHKVSNEDLTVVVPLVYQLCSIIDRMDVCYCIIDETCFRNPSLALSPSIKHNMIRMHIFRALLHRKNPVLYDKLSDIKALSEVFLNEIFVGFFVPLIGQDKAQVVIDAYLLEGDKILYRYGLALLSMFAREIETNTFRSGETLWRFIKQPGRVKFEALQLLTFDRGLSWIDRLFGRHVCPSRAVMTKIRMGFTASMESTLIQLARAPESIKEVTIAAAKATWFKESALSQSNILTSNMELKLHSWLGDVLAKQGMTVQDLKLAFTSPTDGWDIDTLYERAGAYSPCLLLIRSLREKAGEPRGMSS
jgi:Rab-GTPase-TBC domain